MDCIIQNSLDMLEFYVLVIVLLGVIYKKK